METDRLAQDLSQKLDSASVLLAHTTSARETAQILVDVWCELIDRSPDLFAMMLAHQADGYARLGLGQKWQVDVAPRLLDIKRTLNAGLAKWPRKE